MFGIVWVYNKVTKTHSMIVSPSTILLQPHVGGFHASEYEEKISISDNFRANSLAISGVQQHAGATIVDVWHCMGV